MRSMIAIVILIMTVGSAFSQTDGRPGNKTENKDVKKKYFYEWTDNKGIVHITDNFGKVPEQYQSKARKIESRKTEPPGRGQQVQGETQYSPVGQAGNAEEAKAEWQQRIKEWKNRLAAAGKRYEDLDRERNELFRAWGSAALAPIENRVRAEQIEQQMKEVRQEIDDAKNMIEVVIPEEARKAGVPPGWLRE